ncbi:hypothetical protein HMPREF0077_0475 [Anaerococcus tetradius ATCC 35098]|uniref:Uncharacterized protein n=1 Tax=Anaerococcus tetradius ATCC 35098 TaxID=525255 RepID=C2CG65_9FIRM|nr:hypothetical protein HMPREF0077_0475 [Anaerococcus tetradius ATCC 35098]
MLASFIFYPYIVSVAFKNFYWGIYLLGYIFAKEGLWSLGI